MPEQSVRGEWRGKTAGGSKHFATWRNNPQYFLYLEHPTNKDDDVTPCVKLSLALAPPSDRQGSPRAPNGFGFYVVKSMASASRHRSQQLLRLASPRAVAGVSGFVARGEATCELTLPPLRDPYIIVPATTDPGEEAAFLLTVWSEHNFTLQPMPPGLKWKEAHVEGEWRGESAGGCRHYSTWRNNPQYLITVTKPTYAVLILTQQAGTRGEDTADIGFYVTATPDGSRRKVTLRSNDVIMKSHFASTLEVSVETELVPREDGGPYVLIPATYSPGCEASFVVSVFSDEEVRLEPLVERQPWHEVALADEWKGWSAGGSLSHPSWRHNPQYFLPVSTTTTIIALLAQPMAAEVGKDYLTSIGLYVLRGDTGTGSSVTKRKLKLSNEDIVASSGFQSAWEVFLSATLEPSDTPYVLVPCTQNVGEEGPFTIVVYTDTPIPVLPVSTELEWKHAAIEGCWSDTTMGGSWHFSSWRENPQIMLSVDRPTRMFIVLSQPELEGGGTHAPLHCIGFCVLRGEKNQTRKLVFRGDDVVARSRFATSREVSCEVKLDPFSNPFVLIPTTYDPNNQGIFRLALHAEHDFTIHESHPPWANCDVSVTGKWTGSTAGGCMLHSSFADNPQFILTVEEKGCVVLSLAQPHEHEWEVGKQVIERCHFLSIGLYAFLVEGETPRCRRREDTSKPVAASNILPMAEAVLELKTEGPSSFVILPTTLNPGESSTFTLTAFSDHRIDLLPLTHP
eukprot:TRINITY_DN11523_c0_g5_i1.p1 TRINITY_DN11523_c0_g5~~TRINITY_DN11523_c0_g5_i1.p1  ORF type:complete len:773 (-),score=112.36 TRINITY_DN11523_c0_g5_i1:96-2309(-)